MQERILISLFVPAAEKDFEVFIPANEILQHILPLIQHATQEVSGGKYAADEDAVLIDEKENILDINRSVLEQGVINGSRLTLI